jgi:hypothetical protein
MSRSVHTRPRHILSANRVRAPHEPRGRSDSSSARTLGRAVKELGLHRDPAPPAPSSDAPTPLPLLRAQRPREGYAQPAGRADISRLLQFFGAELTYGVRSIELVRGRDDLQRGLLLGRLLAPGRVLLYDQPPSPWLLPGRLPVRELERLVDAGAEVESTTSGRSRVTWPGETLREFMLLDVLLHEIGHHVLQHHKGKRRARVARTRDHEAYARAFADRYRRRYRESLCPDS